MDLFYDGREFESVTEHFLVTEAVISGDQPKLKWPLGQVGATKLDSFVMEKMFIMETSYYLGSYLAQIPLKFCLGTEKQAYGF